MKVALIGYGKMGKIIERIAKSRGHEIVSIIDIDNLSDFESDAFKSADVAIEFTRPDTAIANIRKCFKANVPVVVGTTGWNVEEVKEELERGNHTLFVSSNFSIGVNIFMAVNNYLAKLMNRFDNYNVEMTEVHHIHKLDAPSGTAITLAEGILENLDRKNSWTKGTLLAADKSLTGSLQCNADELRIDSIREGEVPGIHEISYQSDADTITIVHNAKNRSGLALGAVMAAEYTAQHRGFLTMDDLMDSLSK